jgi:hypothetical protein
MFGLAIGGPFVGAIINSFIGAATLLLVIVGFSGRSAGTAGHSTGSHMHAAQVEHAPNQEISIMPSPSLSRIDSPSEPQPTKNRTQSLFLSYRRSDSLDVTGRIYDRLTREYGGSTVFRDLDSIPLGIDFREHVERVISHCDLCLVVIGSSWLETPNGKGGRRIDDPKDHVRQEIESALRRSIPVVPLLVGGARMPSAEELPASLNELAFRNGMQIRPDPDFHRDMDRLVGALRAKQ